MVTSLENDVKTGKRSKSQPRAKLTHEALQLWDSALTLACIARELGCRTTTLMEIYKQEKGQAAYVSRTKRLYRLSKLRDKNPMLGKTGSLHHNYRGRASDKKGYFTVTTPSWAKKTSKRMFEHHVVWLAFQGLNEIPSGCVIHHINEDKQNNAIYNLVLMTAQEHSILHAWARRCNDYGESQYIRVDGSASALRQREHEIVCSWRRRQAG